MYLSVVQVTKDITELSAAAFLKEIGKKCPVTARLSTVVHEKGCALHRADLFILLCNLSRIVDMLHRCASLSRHVATLGPLPDKLCRSPESLRDVRGFSVKFYTEEGNWDFVGNDIPVRPLL